MLMHRKPAIAAAGAAVAALTVGGVLTFTAAGSPRPVAASAVRQHAAPNTVLAWNDALAEIVRDPALQPKTIHPTRSMAMMNAAIFDAVTAVEGRQPQYATRLTTPLGTSSSVAVATAAHDVLVALYPRAAVQLGRQLQADLRAGNNAAADKQGVVLGRQAAAAILRLRSHDGSGGAVPSFVATATAGRYQPVPPQGKPPVFRGWGTVHPFALTSPREFRLPPPPPLASVTYAASYNSVKRLGASHSSARTDDQTEAAKFWNAPIQDFWNQVARETAEQHHLGLAASARLFAGLDITMADTVIAMYDSKYAFDLWRPITAIREAGRDGNAATTADPRWLPLTPTQPDPSYPGAHSAVSAAAATVLTAFYGTDLSNLEIGSPALKGVSRQFTSFSSVAREAALSRIWAGVHTPIDDAAGRRLGRDVATRVLQILPVTATTSY